MVISNSVKPGNPAADGCLRLERGMSRVMDGTFMQLAGKNHEILKINLGQLSFL
jgi:hypothetical protein